MKKSLLLIIFLAITALICEIIYQIFFPVINSTWGFFLAASILISISAIIIRLNIVDSQKFSSLILETDIYSKKNLLKQKLNPARFLNLMPIAMITCSLADSVLPISFIMGMLTFLIAQILYITAYSGIINLNPKILFAGDKKSFFIGSLITWILISTIMYTLFVYSPTNSMTLMVIPYVIILTLMVLSTFIAFGYTNRPFKFKISLCGGGISFFISDSILAFNEFKASFSIASFLISATYLLAVFLLQFAILFIHSAIKN